MLPNRQLAVIVFTDIVGYTALMGEDEKKAFELLQKNRNIQHPLIVKHSGRFIKELGDGILATFSTATDAVTCSLDIQQSCTTLDDLKLRIGIHMGEVIFENGDVFGDGVNIAARLQALAPVSGIWISESVYNSISNKREFAAKFMGQESLKNVKELIRVYEVSSNNIVTTRSNHIPVAKKSNEKSIAVLPFFNMSNDPEQEYFGHGISEEIINSLAHIKDLKVAGRMSSFQFQTIGADLRVVGEKLGVDTVLEGSIRKQGNKLRVTAQLIEVKSGFHLWSEKFDRTMDDIFAIQDEIALAITTQLKVTLLEQEKQTLTRSSTHNAEAYEHYLKGRFCINRRGSNIPLGYQHFQKAIEIDNQFALAYAGLADACLLLAYYSYFPAKEVMPKAKSSAEKAIALDSSLPEPYTSLGFYYTFFEWNWSLGKKNFLKALDVNPDYVTGRFWYGMLYVDWIERDFPEAMYQGNMAIKLDPLSAIAHAIHSVNYYVVKDYDEAIRLCKTALELDGNHYLGHQMMGLAYVGLKKFPDAIESLTHAMKISNGFQWSLFNLAFAYGESGDKQKMRELIDELDSRSKTEYISPFHRGLAAAWDGDLDLAIEWVKKAMEDRDPILLTINTWGNVPEVLTNDPRCQQLITQINFPAKKQ
jgi:TolB-like protein/class 3 adenylate cyclase